MEERSRKKIVVSVLIAFLLIVFIPPYFNLNHFRSHLERAISDSLGRPVTLGDVSPQVFPRPGLYITNFVVADDPAFSAEPLLRAEEVLASLRWTSLWRGRLEIARLQVKYPSLNLVRSSTGHWNLESLLAHATQLSTAPTANPRPEARPRFPYIEAVSGRINLKIGEEKKLWALADADFSLWMASENQWQTRLAARPMRSDQNLNDVGTVRLSGEFSRAAVLSATPLKISFTWQKAQLGQLTKLVYGQDRGWRGGINLSGFIEGAPADFRITADAAVSDFRRYDISNPDPLSFQLHCSAMYQSRPNGPAEYLPASSGVCNIPVGEGEVVGRAGWADRGKARYVQISARNLPLAAVAMLAQRMKKDLPRDFAASGVVNAAFQFDRSPDPEASAADAAIWGWRGGGIATSFTLRSALLGPDLALGNVSFILNQNMVSAPPASPGFRPATAYSAEMAATENHEMNPPQQATQLLIGPITADLGGTAPIALYGIVTQKDYLVYTSGSATLPRLIRLGRLFGLPPILPYSVGTPGNARDDGAHPAVINGNAIFDLAIAGNWAAFSPPSISGTMQLQSVTTVVPRIARPIVLTSAALQISPSEVVLKDIAAFVSGTGMILNGAIRIPRRCGAAGCVGELNLQANQIDVDQLNRLRAPEDLKTRWSIFGGNSLDLVRSGGSTGQKPLALLASPGNDSSATGEISGSSGISWKGRVSTKRFLMKDFSASQVSTEFSLSNGNLFLTNLRAKLLGGSHYGNCNINFSGKAPAYEARGVLENVSMSEAAALMRENWVAGKASFTYHLSFSGSDSSEFKRTAAATLNFNWRNGALRRISFYGGAPLTFQLWAGKAEIGEGSISLTETTMRTSAGSYQVRGAASFDRNLDLAFLKEHGKAPAYVVTGTLSRPVVAPASPDIKPASLTY